MYHSAGSPQPGVQLLLNWQWLYAADIVEHDLFEHQAPAWFLPALLFRRGVLNITNTCMS